MLHNDLNSVPYHSLHPVQLWFNNYTVVTANTAVYFYPLKCHFLHFGFRLSICGIWLPLPSPVRIPTVPRIAVRQNTIQSTVIFAFLVGSLQSARCCSDFCLPQLLWHVNQVVQKRRYVGFFFLRNQFQHCLFIKLYMRLYICNLPDGRQVCTFATFESLMNDNAIGEGKNCDHHLSYHSSTPQISQSCINGSSICKNAEVFWL